MKTPVLLAVRRASRRGWNRKHLALYGLGGLLLMVGLLLLLRSATVPTAPLSGVDFRVVAYQGEDTLGGHESQFSHVTAQGKPVVLNFFAGQCPPCRAEMPGFQKIADEFQGKVIFVGVDIGPYVHLGSHEDAERLLSELHVRYPAAYAVDSSPLTIYNVLGMPTTVIFDSKGKVVERHTGILTEGELRQKLMALAGS